MKEEHWQLIQKLVMSLDTCMELVVAEARKEKRNGEGYSFRPITWQQREKFYAELLADALDILASGERKTIFSKDRT